MALVLVAPPVGVGQARQPNHGRSKIILATMTFHNARPNRPTCFGRRQAPWMAAINRKKNHPLMGKKLIPYAYWDKKANKKVFVNLPPRRIADVTGPALRRQKNYHIDYYLPGQMPAEYEKYNNTTWYFKVVD